MIHLPLTLNPVDPNFIPITLHSQVACSRQKDNQFYGFAIGMTVLSGAMTVGSVSGGAFNPAVSTGLQLAKCCVTGRCVALSYIWLYWLSHFGAAALAAVCFLIIHPKSGIKQHTGAEEGNVDPSTVLPSFSKRAVSQLSMTPTIKPAGTPSDATDPANLKPNPEGSNSGAGLNQHLL
jgi:hypothetical protein